MWPFKSKKKEAQEMWNILSGKLDPKAMEKMVDAIRAGDTETTERLFKQIMDHKVREIERNI